MRILFSRHVSGFLEHWHIHKTCRIALSARIAIPIPSPAKVATLFNDPNAIDTLLLEPGASYQSGEASANEGESDMVGDGISILDWGIRVLKVVWKMRLDFDVLLIAIVS